MGKVYIKRLRNFCKVWLLAKDFNAFNIKIIYLGSKDQVNVRQLSNCLIMSGIQFPKQAAHKLHLVTLIRSGIGRPYWEKRCLKKLGLTKRLKSVVLKNTPEINEDLRMIKTIIKVQPIIFNDNHSSDTVSKIAPSLRKETEDKFSDFPLITGSFINEKGEFNLSEFDKYIETFPDDELEKELSKNHVKGSELRNRDFYFEEEQEITKKEEKVALYFLKKTWHHKSRLETRLKNLTKY